MAKDDLFDEEEHGMVRMTFGEHLEDLRRRLILSLIMIIPCTAFGLYIGDWLVEEIARPAKTALNEYAARRRVQRLKDLDVARAEGKTRREQLRLRLDPAELRKAIAEAFPELKLLPDVPPDSGNASETNATNTDSAERTGAAARSSGETATGEKESGDKSTHSNGDGLKIEIKAEVDHEEMEIIAEEDYWHKAMITLNPQEAFMAYFKVSLVAGIVLASWWIIYQLWQFVAEGLYKHERRIVYRAMPVSVGLFSAGVLFCFFIVLPVVLNFFFGINEWLNIPPNIRLTEWLGFATILPLIFGVCFELPLVMLVLESVGIFRVDDYIAKWKHAILIIAIVAMFVTPTTDPGSMMLLMGPMAGLYFLGIGLVQMRRGGLRALSATAKLRTAVGALVTLYVIGVSIGFALPASWIEKTWWLHEVWMPGTLPVSWLLRSQLENPSTNWLWAVTLGNAFFIGLVLLRVGELLQRLGRAAAKK
jgi:sec-independent protein translocase protein TatC